MKSAVLTETPVLVIGYGSALRTTEATGPCIAGRIESLGLPGVRTIACPQLFPELAGALADADAVVFVDTASDHAGDTVLEPISGLTPAQDGMEAPTPESLLGLAREIYRDSPAAWRLHIPASACRGTPDQAATTSIESAVGLIRMLAAEWTF